MTKPRQARDDEDSRTLLGYLQERNPFDCDLLMRNISTGVTGDCTVNADRGKEVEETILKSMVGNNVQEYTFKKKNHLVTMGQKKSFKVDGEPLQIDPQLLFQRLTTVAQNMTENVVELFQYELFSQPSFLFCEKVATSNTTVQVQSLPPASAAARYDSARVYLQNATVDGKREKFKSRRLGMVKNSIPASCAHY